MKSDAGSPPPLSRAARAVRDLSAGYFAFVMASGIISTGAFLLGPSWLSQVLLAVAIAGFVVLGVALTARLVRFRPRVEADLRTPERAFEFFSITAGLDVLGVRFAISGHPLVTAILAAIAAALWLLLNYGVPASVLLSRTRDSVLGGVNGTWLLWIVATQSLSLAAAVLLPAWPSQTALLAPIATGLWSVGLVLYLLVVALILMHWLTVPMTPATFGPQYWILMGATAISVLAGAKDLALPASTPVVRETAGFVEGFTFALWAFGTWWIPLLVILSLWRHVRGHWPLRYEPGLWSVVFPLGMYSVATLTFGNVAHLTFMEPLARFMFWVAVAAWVLVTVAFLLRLTRADAEPAPRDAAAPPSGLRVAFVFALRAGKPGRQLANRRFELRIDLGERLKLDREPAQAHLIVPPLVLKLLDAPVSEVHATLLVFNYNSGAKEILTEHRGADMETETLAGALEREHHEIDAGIEAFTSGPQAGDARLLSRAIQALRRHIYLEEEFLFPLLREAEPALSAPVFVMLREHGQIWQLLDSLGQEPPSAESRTLCRQLTVLLLHHNLKEEKVLYPQADELLAEPVAARLMEFIASRQLPQGWTCVKAAAAR